MDSLVCVREDFAVRINSRDNEWIKSLVLLRKSAEERKTQKKLLLDGARLCYDAYRSGRRVEKLLYTRSAAEKYDAYLSPIRAALDENDCVEISEPVSGKLSETASPQGVFAVCGTQDVVRPVEEITPGQYICCERLQDPGNLGTVIRTAAALGASGVVMTEDCADWSSQKVLRSTMGALFRIPLYSAADAPSAIAALSAQGVRSFAAVLAEDAVPLSDWSCTPAAFWVGNEGAGLTGRAVEACAGRVTIPMAGGVESLNASVCASILLWVLTREQK